LFYNHRRGSLAEVAPSVPAASATTTEKKNPTMTVLAIVLAACSLWGVVATVLAVRVDGYGSVPTHRS
jgi:hypothetical protein